jgi:hypothetical protein
VIFQNLTIETRLFHPDVFWGNGEPIAITVLRRGEETEPGAVRDVLVKADVEPWQLISGMACVCFFKGIYGFDHKILFRRACYRGSGK